jgi:hypothetical protein
MSRARANLPPQAGASRAKVDGARDVLNFFLAKVDGARDVLNFFFSDSAAALTVEEEMHL